MSRAAKHLRDQTRVIAYTRVSTSEQADSGLGLEAQRTQIAAEAERKGWTVVEWIEDAGSSAKSLDRPGMARALELLDGDAAGALIVAKLDRATRSTMDAAVLLERCSREGWALVALDLGLDMTTPTGELIASVMAAVAQWERRAIGQRTKDALAAKKAAGVRLGRPVSLPGEIRTRIVAAHHAGSGWSAIARQLNEEEIPTAHGGAKWHPSTVRAVMMSSKV